MQLFSIYNSCSAPDHAIDLVDFADSFAAKTNALDLPDIHRIAAGAICNWLDYMRAAAEHSRPDLVAEFARMVTKKFALGRELRPRLVGLRRRKRVRQRVDVPTRRAFADECSRSLTQPRGG